MTTFFFAMDVEDCGLGCQGTWRACPQRYLWALRRIDGLHDVCSLFGDPSGFAPVPDAFPQNGDVIILYVRDRQDLKAMIGAGDLFDGLKKILVVADASGIEGHHYHGLAPRYITQADRDLTELGLVIYRMRNVQFDNLKE